jgi:apolipoprotein N-acyltransferase
MEYPRPQEQRRPWLWLFAAIILALFANGRWLIPLAAWLAPLCFLRFVHMQKPMPGLILGGLGMIAAMHVNWLGMTPLDGNPVLYTLVFAGIGLTFWLPYIADRLVSPRIPGFLSTLVFPAAYTAMELVYTLTNPFSSWGSLAYTQTGWSSFIQIASITGIWGITFLSAWTISVFHWAWKNGFEWKVLRAGVSIYVCIMAAVLGFGQVRLMWIRPASETIRIGAVAASGEDIKWIAASEKENADPAMYTRRILDHYLDRTRILAQGGARIVVWDELAIRISAVEEDEFIGKGKELARREGIYLLMGLGVGLDPDTFAGSIRKPRENKAVLIAPDGSVLIEYLKGNPAPGSRDVPGSAEPGRADTPVGRLAAAICYDTVFPEFFRTAGLSQTGLLMVPTWDNPGIEYLHMEMGRIRAVENGTSLITSTREGYSAAFDGLGRPLALSGRNAPDRMMFADVPVESMKTLYPIIGDAFGWLCLLGFLALMIVSAAR